MGQCEVDQKARAVMLLGGSGGGGGGGVRCVHRVEVTPLWIHTSVSFISSLSSMPSTPRQPWLMLLYKLGSSLTRSFSGEEERER